MKIGELCTCMLFFIGLVLLYFGNFTFAYRQYLHIGGLTVIAISAFIAFCQSDS